MSQAEPQIVSEAQMDRPLSVKVTGGEVCYYSVASPDKDTPNEDALAIIPSGGALVLAVADGLGGMNAGNVASATSLGALAAQVQHGNPPGDEMLRTRVIDGFELANEAVRALNLGAATTLAAVEIRSGILRPYHVGDSSILVVGNRGKIKLQSIPHSPVGYLVEAGALDEEEAMHHAERHLVSNVIGGPEMRLDIGPHIPLAPLDRVLIASDGLMDNLHLDEIVEIIRSGDLRRSARELVKQSQTRMEGSAEGDAPSKPDDLSFLLFRSRSRS